MKRMIMVNAAVVKRRWWSKEGSGQKRIVIQETENDIMVNGAIRQQAKMELMRDPKTGARGQKRSKYWSKYWSKCSSKYGRKAPC